MEEAQRLEEPKMSTNTFSFRRLQDMVPARVVLYFLSFTGFVVSFMMRNDINIAMVVMVRLPPPASNASNASTIPMYCYDPGNITEQNAAVNATVMDEGEFDWSAKVQSAIQGSFYWCYILSQVVGGILTQRFGTKAVFGVSQLVTAICSLLIPSAASVHYGAVILLRSIQGIASGLTWPAMYAIVGHWIPAIERSRFMSSFQGFSFGIGLTYSLCGILMVHFGWRVVFYLTGTVGVLWCLMWWLLAFDTPAEHPRISASELHYIESNVGNTAVGYKGLPVPWRSIFTSLPVLTIGITSFGCLWVHYIFIISGPMYMKTVHGFSIQKNGLMSGAPFLCSYLSAVFYCYLADVLVNHKLLSLTKVRKLFTAISQIVPALLLLGIGYLECNITLVLIAWFLAVTLITASNAGAMANFVDIAPNLAGPVLAFAYSISMTASFLSTFTAGEFLEQSQTLEQWRQVFWVAAAVACSTCVFFQIFGTAEIQAWNYPEQKLPSDVIQTLQQFKEKEETCAFNGETAEG